MSETGVCAAILAWNQLQETRECLDSLFAMDTQPYSVVLIDNGSTDGTSEIIHREYPEVIIIRSEQNLGVAGGYNLGIKYALEQGADYVLIMNNDVVVQPDFLTQLLLVANNEVDAGIIQPKIYNYYRDNTLLWIVGARWRQFPPAIKMIGYNQPDGDAYSYVRQLEFVPSCVLLLARQAIEKAGMFDEQYFFYFDDWDFSIRVRQAGFNIYFAPEAKMWHKVSVSTIKNDKPSKWWYIMGQSSVKFHTTYQGVWISTLVNVWFVIREILKGKFNRIPPYVAGAIGGHARRKGWISNTVAKPDVSILEVAGEDG